MLFIVSPRSLLYPDSPQSCDVLFTRRRSWYWILSDDCTTGCARLATFLSILQTYGEFMAFVRLCNDAVTGVRTTSSRSCSSTVDRIVAMLTVMGSWVDDFPPLEEPMRFGNKAFRCERRFVGISVMLNLRPVVSIHVREEASDSFIKYCKIHLFVTQFRPPHT